MSVSTQPQAYPCFHHKTPYAGECSKAAAEFDKLLGVWHQVADVMKALPVGAVARINDLHIGHAYLMMVPYDGEIVLFWASSTQADSIWTPELGTDRIESDLRLLRVGLLQWLTTPVYVDPVDPAVIKAAWQEQFGVEVGEQWVWSGNSPVPTPYTVFCRQADNKGTTYIGAVQAYDIETASLAGIEQCSDEWGGYDVEKIVCTGVIEGNVNVLHWDDPVE